MTILTHDPAHPQIVLTEAGQQMVMLEKSSDIVPCVQLHLWQPEQPPNTVRHAVKQPPKNDGSAATRGGTK